MIILAVFYLATGRVLPGHRADRRLHRRDHDAVPVRGHAGRHHRRRLAQGDASRASGWLAVLSGLGFGILLIAGIGNASLHTVHRPDRGQRRRQRRGPGQADLHQVRVGLRDHRRAADHRGRRRDGAHPPRAHRAGLAPSASWPSSGCATAVQVPPLPAPGVYARHNAVDIPGLLPDGTPSELTVNPTLRARGQIRDVSGERPHQGCGSWSSGPTSTWAADHLGRSKDSGEGDRDGADHAEGASK